MIKYPPLRLRSLNLILFPMQKLVYLILYFFIIQGKGNETLLNEINESIKSDYRLQGAIPKQTDTEAKIRHYHAKANLLINIKEVRLVTVTLLKKKSVLCTLQWQQELFQIVTKLDQLARSQAFHPHQFRLIIYILFFIVHSSAVL